ncbi:hypothetical protein KJK32_34220 [Streptomyces sp. JCM17656]|nr:hypothetical protein KJK32_34220 [Streptomyces sp. JCM17656]
MTAAGASVLRVRLAGAAAPAADGGSTTVALTVADGSGAPVATVADLTLRPLSAELLRAADTGSNDGLLRVEWSRPATTDATPDTTLDLAAWAVVGPASDLGLPSDTVRSYTDLGELARAVDAGEPAPTVLLAPTSPRPPVANCRTARGRRRTGPSPRCRSGSRTNASRTPASWWSPGEPWPPRPTRTSPT